MLPPPPPRTRNHPNLHAHPQALQEVLKHLRKSTREDAGMRIAQVRGCGLVRGCGPRTWCMPVLGHLEKWQARTRACTHGPSIGPGSPPCVLRCS